ncbi:MAG: hypothetical protein RMK97_06750 [Sutterellaceae bacterium]|nr:hypothetical protein [Burkholderiaceae bacterium]MCX7901954.1 hypothetical protein [Burkholderiaceae bacterium]MDW8430186.1 hypothetical protein [Sutterellaceae bacterium]
MDEHRWVWLTRAGLDFVLTKQAGDTRIRQVLQFQILGEAR